MFKIEKDVPVPLKEKFKSKYPWDKLEIGESFFVEGKNTRSMAANINYSNNRLRPKHFICRSFPDGVRVWRDK